jgi:hypothetical protein
VGFVVTLFIVVVTVAMEAARRAKGEGCAGVFARSGGCQGCAAKEGEDKARG